ncbi:MAG: hypothetical protein ACYS7Y_11730 [Planctomycetota bacterium]|jgi:hypothetical protein
MRIENWSVFGANADPYQAPETQRVYLQGEVYGHPRFTDGEFVYTSHVVSVDGPVVTTKSGSVYTLGEPKPDYVEWCRETGCHVPTQDEPIKLKGLTMFQFKNLAGYTIYMSGTNRGEALALGTHVTSDMEGRCNGMVIGYNMGKGCYDDQRYPYVVLWEDGYIEVYSEASFSPVRK